MRQKIRPAKRLTGTLILPGDKSISHRYAMISAIAEGVSRITNYSTGADCHSTLGCIRALGIEVREDGTTVEVHGKGLDGWSKPHIDLNAGNSGSTIRMLSGLLSAQNFSTCIFGDESLSRRPMERIIKPLGEMGARIEARDGKFPPLTIHGGKVRAIDYTLPVASAQVKSCVLFAGLYADGATTVHEPVRSRDHSEIALRTFGAQVEVKRGMVTLQGRPTLTGRDLSVPGDLSGAAFFLTAALIVPDSRLVIQNVGLNPTRSTLLDFLVSIGAPVRVSRIESSSGELVGDIEVTSPQNGAPVRGGVIEGDITAALIDEIPVLSVLGAVSKEGLIVRDAQELRLKETDRIATIAHNLERMGVKVERTVDGMQIPGQQKLHGAHLDSFGDHRIAMAFAVAALAADGESEIAGADAASVSFPSFWEILGNIRGD
jgi:3-phosphoshikimate 1-carboxyvinyltransferase